MISHLIILMDEPIEISKVYVNNQTQLTGLDSMR